MGETPNRRASRGVDNKIKKGTRGCLGATRLLRCSCCESVCIPSLFWHLADRIWVPVETVFRTPSSSGPAHPARLVRPAPSLSGRDRTNPQRYERIEIRHARSEARTRSQPVDILLLHSLTVKNSHSQDARSTCDAPPRTHTLAQASNSPTRARRACYAAQRVRRPTPYSLTPGRILA